MFQTVVNKPAPTALPPLVGAAFPDRSTLATGYAAGQITVTSPYRASSSEKESEPER